MDFNNASSIVIRVCEGEDYCESNPCVAFCDNIQIFNRSIKWTPTRIAERMSEFQKRFNVILNDETSTDGIFDRESEYIRNKTKYNTFKRKRQCLRYESMHGEGEARTN